MVTPTSKPAIVLAIPGLSSASKYRASSNTSYVGSNCFLVTSLTESPALTTPLPGRDLGEEGGTGVPTKTGISVCSALATS